MPQFDLTGVPDATDFEPLPDGAYPCACTQVEEVTTKNGDPMWKIEWAVCGGPFDGRKIFDNLVFNKAAAGRVKCVAKRVLGLDATGPIDIHPRDLEGRHARVTVTENEYVASDGSTKKNNKVTFAGYESPEAKNAAPKSAGEYPFDGAAKDDDTIPF